MSDVKKDEAAAPCGPVVVNPMRKRHLDQILAIEARAYPNPWTRTVFENELAQGITRSYVVAQVGREVVGYCGVLYVVDEAHITNIAVDPRYHRMRIGTRLMAHAVRQAWDRRITGITLEVRMSNFAAQRLYQKFGFQPAGVRRGYYQDSGEDAMIMWAYDVDSPEYRERVSSIEAAAGIRAANAKPKRRLWR